MAEKNHGRGASHIKADGWANILTGLGIKGKDKRMDSKAVWSKMDESTAEELYAADDIAAKVVDFPVDDSLREGWKLVGIDEDKAKKLEAEFHDRLKLQATIEKAWKFSRIYGGGGILIMTTDTDDLATPFNPARGFQIKAAQAFTRWELQGQDIDSDLSSPNYGLPKYYSVSPRGGQSGGDIRTQKIHYSRIIRFEGKLLTPRQFAQNSYWHDSFLNALQNSLLNFNTAHDSAALAVQDFRTAVFKLQNLQSLVANNKDDLVTKRLEIINLGKSIAKAVVIDAEKESFEHSSTTFTGIPEILEKLTKRLQAATPLPHTRLFGDSPSGMGGSGRHEETNWYDYVASLQEQVLYPSLQRLYRTIAAQTTVAIQLPDTFDIEFNPLWQMDEKEVVELRAKQAESDRAYMESGVLDPTEIRESRFGTGKWAIDTTLKAVPEAKVPEETAPASGQPSSVDVAKQALNGAQVASVLQAVQNVVLGMLPRDAAVNIILKAFPFLSSEEAEAMVGSAGKGFTPPANAAQLMRQDGSTVQSLIFSREHFKDEEAAKKWAEEHGFNFGKVDATRISFRLRQEDPGKFKTMRTKELAPGVSAVIGITDDEVQGIDDLWINPLIKKLTETQEKGDSDDTIPPKSVQDNAAKGLELRKKWGRGGTNIGVKRATDLSGGKNLSRTTIARMSGFARHLADYDPSKVESDGGPTAQHIAVMLWGGREGIEWAQAKLKEIDGGK